MNQSSMQASAKRLMTAHMQGQLLEVGSYRERDVICNAVALRDTKGSQAPASMPDYTYPMTYQQNHNGLILRLTPISWQEFVLPVIA